MDVVAFEGVVVVRESNLALLCVIDGRCIWVPRGQILNGELCSTPDRGRLVIPRWLARDQRLL
jgi:hypothetical protein